VRPGAWRERGKPLRGPQEFRFAKILGNPRPGAIPPRTRQLLQSSSVLGAKRKGQENGGVVSKDSLEALLVGEGRSLRDLPLIDSMLLPPDGDIPWLLHTATPIVFFKLSLSTTGHCCLSPIKRGNRECGYWDGLVRLPDLAGSSIADAVKGDVEFLGMRSESLLPLIFLFACMASVVGAQSAKTFPSPESMLRDAKHKEPKSGVQLGPGNTLTIQQGVGTPTTINILSFGKNGTLLAAGKDFGRVVVWDVATRKFLCAIDTGQGILHAVAISPDGQIMATAGEGDRFSLKLWRLPDGQLIKNYNSFGGYIRTATFGPNSLWIVLSDNTSTTRVLDLTTGKQLLELKETHSPVLSPDATVLMVVNKSEFALWNTSDWTQQRTLPRAPVYAIPLALNPATDQFVVTSSGVFLLARLSTGELLTNSPAQPLPKFNGAAGGFAAFDTSAPYLLFGHSDARLWAWDSRNGQTCTSDVLYSESGALSPDGGVLAGAKDNSILAQGQSPDGVLLWDTKRLAAKCGFGPQ